jgi:cyclase
MFALGRRSRFIRKAFLLVAGLLLVCGFGAQDRDFSKVEIKVSNVAGNVYILEGVGENIGASVGEDGIVLVDDN